MFEDGFAQELGITEITEAGTFYSRNNEVSLLKVRFRDGREEYLVNKSFKAGDNKIRVEGLVLNILNDTGLSPKLVYQGSTNILMEYVPGMTLLEFISREECSGLAKKSGGAGGLSAAASNAVKLLCVWLKDFYMVMEKELGYGVVLVDPNLRNFILNDSIYGVDFEAVRRGRPEVDLGRICAYVLTYQPEFTKWKYCFVKSFIEEISARLKIDRDFLRSCMEAELAAIKIRRGK